MEESEVRENDLSDEQMVHIHMAAAVVSAILLFAVAAVTIS